MHAFSAACLVYVCLQLQALPACLWRPSCFLPLGHMKRTDKGELSVVVTSWTMLTKAIQPLPDKWHGLADVEARYRRRYVDMIVTPGVTDTLRARSKTISALRRALEDRGFLEVGGVGWRVGWGSWAWERVQPWLKPSG